MNTPARLLIGLGAIGGTTGAGYAIHQQLSTEDIRKKLITHKYEILPKTSDEWTTILTHYKERISEGKNDLQFGDFKGTETTTDAKEALKTECEKILNSTEVNESNYQKAIKWCTVPKKLSEILKNKKYRSLNTDADSTPEKDIEAWNKKMEDHEKHNKQAEKISDLGLDPAKVKTKDKTERNKLKIKCKGFENKKHYEKDFETILNKSMLWCAINE